MHQILQAQRQKTMQTVDSILSRNSKTEEAFLLVTLCVLVQGVQALSSQQKYTGEASKYNT